MAVSSKELMKDTIIGLKRAMDITTRLSSWAENDMKAEDIALNAKHEIERLREALRRIEHSPHGKVYCADGHEEAVLIARSALQQNESES